MNFGEKIKLVLGSPRNLKNYYFHALDLKKRPPIKSAQFVSAQIEPTTRCNLACKMCLHSIDKLQKPDMSLGQFKNILDQLPFLANLTLQGLGEPLLNFELFSMIEEAKKRGIRVGLTTNATLLNEENSRKIIDSRLDWVYASMDTADKDLYEKIRLGASFEKTVSNIRAFLKMNPQIDFGFWTLVMKETAGGLDRVVDLAESLGVRKIVFQDAIHNWGHGNFKDDVSVSKNTEQLKKAIKQKMGRVKAEINISQNQGEVCNWPWRSLYITADGYLTPCCMQGSDPEIINFGNVFKEPLKNIVNNQKYRVFRKTLNSPAGGPADDRHRVCRDCPAYYKQMTIKL